MVIVTVLDIIIFILYSMIVYINHILHVWDKKIYHNKTTESVDNRIAVSIEIESNIWYWWRVHSTDLITYLIIKYSHLFMMATTESTISIITSQLACHIYNWIGYHWSRQFSAFRDAPILGEERHTSNPLASQIMIYIDVSIRPFISH